MKHSLLSLVSIVTLALAGCAVGPNYKRPTTDTPTHYKAETLGSWKEGQPLDHVPKGDWWKIFGDETLNDLQSRATGANQELKVAVARVEQARATARVARSELLPALNADPSYTRQRFSPNQVPSFGDLTANHYGAALDLSYEIDLWGRVRRGFESARADAQASLAAFHNVLLTLHADVAQNYFALRALDSEISTVTSTVGLRKEQVQLVRSRFENGIGNQIDVARAETELASTEAEAASLAKRRAELENALAILVGENPSTFKCAAGLRKHGTFGSCERTAAAAVFTCAFPAPAFWRPPPPGRPGRPRGGPRARGKASSSHRSIPPGDRTSRCPGHRHARRRCPI